MSDKIKELRNAAQKTRTEARELLDTITETTTAEEAADINRRFDTMMDTADSQAAEAERRERIDRADREQEERRERERRERRPGQDALDHVPGGNVLSDEYRAAFRDLISAGGDVSELSTEARSVLHEYRAQVGNVGAAGGYTVPTTLHNEININVALHGPMMDANFVTEINTSSGNPIDLPTVDDTGEEAGAHTEGNDGVDDDSADVVIGKSQLGAYTLITPWIVWSFELGQDSGFSYEALLGRLIGERLGRKGNKWLTTGDGVTEPQGWVTGAQVGKVAASATVLGFDDIKDLVHSVDPAYRASPRCGFQLHDSSVKALRKIKDANDRYIWDDGDVTKGITPKLDGYQVRINQAMAVAAANAKAIGFGDFGQYYVRKVGSPVLSVAREKFAPNTGILGVHRIDGAIGHGNAIKVLQMAAA
jgi:HK97 family phage major capsid protein